MPMKCGGLSDPAEATHEIQELIEKVSRKKEYHESFVETVHTQLTGSLFHVVFLLLSCCCHPGKGPCGAESWDDF